MTIPAAPTNGRELAAYLAEHGLVRVVGLRGTPFVGIVVRIGPDISIRPVTGGRDVSLYMPNKWTGEGKRTAQDNLRLKEALSFTSTGFCACGVKVYYLDEQDPFR